MLRVTPRTRGLRTWRPGWPMPPQVLMTGTLRPRSWRRNSKRPRPTRSGRGPLWPIVSHGVHPHPKGVGVRAVGVRAVSPPPQHVASPQSRNDYPHPTPPLQLYAESWCTARCTSWVYKCTMCSLGLQGHAGRGRIGARLCSGNERQRELICLSNAHAHANFPRWFHWTTIQVVQCDTSQRMPGHRHIPLAEYVGCASTLHPSGRFFVLPVCHCFLGR